MDLESGFLKNYAKSLKLANDDKNILCANRRGIVPLNSESDKPIFTDSELIEQRHLGLSFKQIGKKLGIDPHKEDVLQVYQALNIDGESVKGQSKVTPPTPFWYLFKSEKEVIQDHVLVRPTDILQLHPHDKVVERLGENAGFMFGIYLEVSKVVSEEIGQAISGASPSSKVGQLTKWNGELCSDVVCRVAHIEQEVAKAAYHVTNYSNPEIGRCMCSAIKILRFGWHTDPIPHPSFFWGCSRYTPVDAGKHDKGTPVRKTLLDIIKCDTKVSHMSDKDLKLLSQKLSSSLTSFWEQQPDTIGSLFEKQTKVLYGVPSETTSKSQVVDVLTEIIEEIEGLLQDRQDVCDYMKETSSAQLTI